ncbi:MAG TPA: VOC family protein [Acidimicrobiales bacterium]|nr:VOC family protein [Acidimicrobiales bacterium]
MALRMSCIAVDAHDPPRLATFWSEALGWPMNVGDDGDVEVWTEGAPGVPILFLKVPEDKAVKNRLHIDLSPDDQAAEVARLEDLGATRTSIGQTGEESWVVLADPEGNEFCVLAPEEV